jgi:uncharacterized membrane protein YphA (DoxX/SURF4 family)
MGFLSGATGPFAGFYQSIAGAGWVNWIFMIGLLGIAVALLLGIGMRIAAVSGAVLLVLMWSASLPPQDDIFMDNHIIYALVLIGLALVAAGNTFSQRIDPFPLRVFRPGLVGMKCLQFSPDPCCREIPNSLTCTS